MSALAQPRIHYRPMTQADLPAVARLEKSLYAFPWSQGNFRDSLGAGYECWSVCENEVLIGYGVLMVALDEAHILNVAVASGWQRRGIGAGLVRHLVETARRAGALIVYLEVRPSNTVARQLYRTLGFQQIAIRPNYYPAIAGREDALFLGLTL
jgi:ribosomal-protein-alanine N-acetyltransferase